MNLNKYIDHTVLKPFAQEEHIEKLCSEAKKYDFASVCINSSYIPLAKELLKGTDVNICTVIGFPLGACATEVKVAETEYAYNNGCDEFDMVIHVGALKDKKYDYLGSIGIILGCRQDPNRYFCSEWCSEFLGLANPSKITPCELYKILNKEK